MGAKLNDKFAKSKFSRESFTKASGLSKKAIDKMLDENYVPDKETQKVLAMVLGCKVEDIF
jgi:DNA-binding XRE family transcriptional regulator